MRTAALITIALAMWGAVAFASGFPTVTGNTYQQARRYPVMDTLSIPNNRVRGVYLIEPSSGTVRTSIDSLLEAWRNGGATPQFRKIQHLILMHNSTDEEQLRMTIFNSQGTSHFRWVDQPYQVLDLPIEADSIQFQCDPATSPSLDLFYIIW